MKRDFGLNNAVEKIGNLDKNTIENKSQLN
jgi:hypothetical protein